VRKTFCEINPTVTGISMQKIVKNEPARRLQSRTPKLDSMRRESNSQHFDTRTFPFFDEEVSTISPSVDALSTKELTTTPGWDMSE